MGLGAGEVSDTMKEGRKHKLHKHKNPKKRTDSQKHDLVFRDT